MRQTVPGLRHLLPQVLSGAATQQVRQQRCHEDHQEDKKQNLGDSSRRERDTSEPQESRDQRDYQKYQSIVEHMFSFALPCDDVRLRESSVSNNTTKNVNGGAEVG